MTLGHYCIIITYLIASLFFASLSLHPSSASSLFIFNDQLSVFQCSLFTSSFFIISYPKVIAASTTSAIETITNIKLSSKSDGPKFAFPRQFFQSYRTLDEIAGFMKYLSITRTRASVQMLKIGYSYEGRPIRALRVTGRNRSRTRGNDKSSLPKTRGILITAGVHAREWVTPAATLYAISKIIESYGMPGNESLTEMLDACTLHIIPIVNPDGYRFTWKHSGALQLARYRLGTHTGTRKPKPAPLSRLWRDNRRKLGKGQIGVDLNRNWGSPGLNWGKGVSNIKSMNYQGKFGFSEPETQTVRRYAMKRSDINVFLDVHCCIKSIRAPFSMEPYNDTMANEYARVGQAMVEAMTEAQGRPHRYTFRPKERGRFSSGLSTGWALTELGIGNSFTIELGGKFISPFAQIKIDGEELLAAILVAMAEATTTNKTLEEHAVVPSSFGDLVLAWQKFLKAGGFFPKGVGASRFFGPTCTKATIRWQEIHNLTANGYFDIPTQKRATIDPTYTINGQINKNVFSYQPKPLSRPARSQVVGEKFMSKLAKYAAGKRMDAGSTSDDYGESNEDESNEDSYGEDEKNKQKMDKVGTVLADIPDISRIAKANQISASVSQEKIGIAAKIAESLPKPTIDLLNKEEMGLNQIDSDITNNDTDTPDEEEIKAIIEFNKQDASVEKELMKLAMLAEKDDETLFKSNSINENLENYKFSGGISKLYSFSVGISFPIKSSQVVLQNKWATLKLAQRILMLMIIFFSAWILIGRRLRSKMQQQPQYQARSTPLSLLTVYFSSNYTLIGLAIAMIILFIFSL